jgi:hypothetical protein
MNFNLDIHNKIITILESLNSELLTTTNTYFGGGTRKCFYSLQIKETQIPQIIDGIDLLACDFGLNRTKRTFNEQHDIFNG